MNLKAIVDVKAKLDSDRSGQAEQLSQEAYLNLAQAEESGFTDKQKLKICVSLFIRSIRQKPSQTQSYIGLGYVLLLLDDRVRAVRYLKEAQKSDPKNQDVLRLLEHAQKMPVVQKSTTTKSTQADVPPAELPRLTSTELNLDELYDEVEATLHKQLRQLILQSPPQPTLVLAEQEQLKEKSEQLAESFRVFQAQLEVLEAGFDTADLRLKMRSLEIQQRRYQQVLAHSQQMQQVRQHIHNLLLRTRDLILGLPSESVPASELVASEKQLDLVMDECDSIADALDTMSQKKQSIEPLEGPYQELIVLVEALRERLDGAYI